MNTHTKSNRRCIFRLMGILREKKKQTTTTLQAILACFATSIVTFFPSFQVFFVCVVLKTIVALNSSVSASASFCAYILRFFWEKGFHSKNGNRVFFFRRSSDGLLTTVRGKLNVLSCESSLWQTPTNLR